MGHFHLLYTTRTEKKHDLSGTAIYMPRNGQGWLTGGSFWGVSPSWQSQTGRVWVSVSAEGFHYVALRGTAWVCGVMPRLRSSVKHDDRGTTSES